MTGFKQRMKASHLADYGVHSTAHILDAFATRAAKRRSVPISGRRALSHSPILPNDPTGVSLLYLRRQKALVFAAVPLPDFFSDYVLRELREVAKEKMECSMRANSRRDEDRADVPGVNNSYCKR